VVRELIALHHSDSIGLPVPGDKICSGDLGFFTPICRICRYHKRFVVRSDHGTIALVEPLRSRADFSGCRAAAFYARLKHLHAVGQVLFFGDMHLLPVASTAKVGEPGARHQAAGRLAGVIYG
jgi:hypothetical protein